MSRATQHGALVSQLWVRAQFGMSPFNPRARRWAAWPHLRAGFESNVEYSWEEPTLEDSRTLKRVLALRVESCSPGLLRLERHSALGDCGPSAGVLAAEPVQRICSS
jgi:hypothetical protein